MLRKTHLVLILVLVFLLTAVTTGLEAKGTDVRGTIKGTDGHPKASTSVKLTGPGNYIAVTNVSGQFFIAQVNPGTYTVTVRHGNNYQEFTRKIPGDMDLQVTW